MKKNEYKKKFTVVFVVLFLFSLICVISHKLVVFNETEGVPELFKLSNSVALGGVEVKKVKNDIKEITYEAFGAKGDGVTNDIEAIRATHDFANKEYIENGIFYTVSPCSATSCSDKTYYLGTNKNGTIDIITDVNWKDANFIIDDYIDANSDGINDVDPTQFLFDIVSPFQVFAKLKRTNFTFLNYDSTFIRKLSSDKVINSNTKNLKQLVDALYDGKISMNTFYKNNTDAIKKYYYSSQRWMIIVTDRKLIHKRKSEKEGNNGTNQSEAIIIDSKTGDVLTNINWTYDDIVSIKVYPIPDVNISVGNGRFITYTSNDVYSNTGSLKSYFNRGIAVSYTGNVKLFDIEHILNEDKHLHFSKYQSKANGNQYLGFININNSSFIDINDLYLSAHTYVSYVDNGAVTANSPGTYDFSISNSANIFMDNVSYACNIYNSNGTKNDDECYKINMINSDRWGIMGSNDTKNLFITNSKMNRIDAHQGITNLYITDSTIGSNGLTLISSGVSHFYGKNLQIDSANQLLSLRRDYGSTWNGTMLLENIKYIVGSESIYPTIVSSDNEENWDFGYISYFPSIYIDGITIDTTTRNAKNVDYVTFVKLSDLYTRGASTIDKKNDRNLYRFKGNIYLNNLIANGNTVKLFDEKFVSSSTDTLNKSSYGGNNVVNLYLDSDVVVDSKVSSNKNPKFKVVRSMYSPASVVKKHFEDIMVKAEMPTSFLKPTIGSINLSTGKLNEKISDNVTNYTATVEADEVVISLDSAYVGSIVSWDSKKVKLDYGKTVVEFFVKDINGERINYKLTINRPYKFKNNVPNYLYDESNHYLYTQNDTDNATIIKKLNITGVKVSIESNNLIIRNSANEKLETIKVVNLRTNYVINNDVINIGKILDYATFNNNVKGNGLTLKVLNPSKTVITSGNISDGYKLEMYSGSHLVKSYIIVTSSEYLIFDDLKVDKDKLIIDDIKEKTVVRTIFNKVVTSGTKNIIDGKTGSILTEKSLIKSGDKVEVKMNDKTYTYVISVDGDVNQDGKVNISDVVMITDHLKNSNLIVEQYLLDAADVDEDGNILTSDLEKIGNYLIDSKSL